MKIKVAVIGCGSISEFRHAPEYKANKNVEIVGFCDPLIERAEKLAEKFGGGIFTDYREVLNVKEIDAVSVCTANSTHAAITIDALKAGKHVLCEKPMATSLDDAESMIQAASHSGKVLMIGHNQRFEPAHIKAKEILKSGELGKVLTFRTNFGHAGPEGWSADKGINTWFFNKNSAFVGTLGDLGIHKADLIRWLIDDEIDEVTSFLATRDKKDDSGNLINVEDNAICLVRSHNGIIGSISSSWTNYGNMVNSVELNCENGIIKINCNPEYEIVVEKRDGEERFYKIKENKVNGFHTDSEIINSFVDSIVNGTEPEISGKEGFEALSIILASIDSYNNRSFSKVRHLV